MRKGHLIPAIILVATLPLAACGRADQPAAATAPATAGPQLTLRMVDMPDWQSVSAEIATVDQAQVIARIPGILSSLSVKEGDVVRKGQVIGRVIDSQLGPQANAYGAQAAAARAQAAQARAELARVKFLYDNGVYAKARLDQARAGADAANAQIRAASAQQAAVGAVAGQGAVIAPANGRVLRADIPVGAPVSPGMTIATITAGDTILRLDLPESLATRVHRGAHVRADLGSGEIIGTVIKVYPSVQSGQVTADVELPGIGNALIGRRVAARVEAGSRRALIVPRRFVTSRFGLDYVTVLTGDGSAASVPVQIAPAGNADSVEILSGAGAGDKLVEALVK